MECLLGYCMCNIQEHTHSEENCIADPTHLMERIKIFYPSNQHKTGFELIPDIYFAVIKCLLHYKYVSWYFLVISFLNMIHIIFEAIIFHKMELPYLELLKHGYVVCGHIYGCASVFSMFEIRGRVLEMHESIKRMKWPIKNVSKRTEEDISAHVILTRSFFYAYGLGTCTYIFLTRNEIYNTLVIQYAVEQHWHRLENFLVTFLMISRLSLCICVTFFPYVQIYFVLEWTVQIALLNDFVEVSSEGREDADYQISVAGLLTKIAHRHIQLMQEYLRVRPLCSKICFRLIVANMLFSPFVIFSTMNGFLTKKIFLLHALSFQVVYTYVTAVGQRYEDKWRTFHKVLCEMPWYRFNIANRKTYLIILIGSSDPVQYVVWNSLALNNELYVKVWKILYTMVNTLYNLRGLW